MNYLWKQRFWSVVFIIPALILIVYNKLTGVYSTKGYESWELEEKLE